MMAIIANGGLKVPLRLVTAPPVLPQFVALKPPEQVITPVTARQLQAMAELVTTEGTGRSAMVESLGTAGKTGSAETGRYREDGRAVIQAWFAGYVPVAHPELVIVVLVEEGESGSSSAAPVFREIVEAIYRQ